MKNKLIFFFFFTNVSNKKNFGNDSWVKKNLLLPYFLITTIPSITVWIVAAIITNDTERTAYWSIIMTFEFGIFILFLMYLRCKTPEFVDLLQTLFPLFHNKIELFFFIFLFFFFFFFYKMDCFCKYAKRNYSCDSN